MDSDVSVEETNNNGSDDNGRETMKRKNDIDGTDMDDISSLAALKKVAGEKESPCSNINDPIPNITVGPPFQPPHLLPYLYPHGLYPGMPSLASLPGLMLHGASAASGLNPSALPFLGSPPGSGVPHNGSSPLSPPSSLPAAHNLLLAQSLIANHHHLLGSHAYRGLASLAGVNTSLSNNSSNTTSNSTDRISSNLNVAPQTTTSPSAPLPILPERLKPPRFTPYLSTSSAPSLSAALSSSLSCSLSSSLTSSLPSSVSSLSSSLFGDSHLGGSSAFSAVSPKASSRIEEAVRRSVASHGHSHAASVASNLKSIEKMVNGLDRRPELTDSLKIEK